MNQSSPPLHVAALVTTGCTKNAACEWERNGESMFLVFSPTIGFSWLPGKCKLGRNIHRKKLKVDNSLSSFVVLDSATKKTEYTKIQRTIVSFN
jgi:hypothetical protein